MAKIKFDNPLPDVHLIAISSHVNDYRLCWAINRSLRIGLARRRTDIEAPGPERTAYFPVFEQLDEETMATIALVGNHAGDGVLIPDQRMADYFLVIDEDSFLRPAEALARLRDTEFVLAAFALDFSKIKGALKLLE